MQCPLDYSLCTQTITLYRKENGTISRKVVDNCYLQWKDAHKTSPEGTQAQRCFLLVMPCTLQDVFPGDRIFAGIGPQICIADWPAFIPAKVARLVQVEYAVPYFWEGKLCHVEAGRKFHS